MDTPSQSAEGVVPGGATDTDTDATFTLRDEDHTLGNALRFALNKNPHVAFCGYSVLHPSSTLVRTRGAGGGH